MRHVVAAIAVAVSVACGGDDPAPEAPEGVRVEYSVKYADSRPGTAHVTYLDADGRTVTADVTTPWRSEPMRFPADGRVELVAAAPDAGVAALQCAVSTDQGPYGRESVSAGQAGCAVRKTVAELGDRDPAPESLGDHVLLVYFKPGTTPEAARAMYVRMVDELKLATRAQRRDTDHAMHEQVLLVAPDEAALARLRDLLRTEPTVQRFEDCDDC